MPTSLRLKSPFNSTLPASRSSPPPRAIRCRPHQPPRNHPEEASDAHLSPPISHHYPIELHKNPIFSSIIACFQKNFRNFAPCFARGTRHIALQPLIHHHEKEQMHIKELPRMGADFSRICAWFVVNREAYSESLRLFAY